MKKRFEIQMEYDDKRVHVDCKYSPSWRDKNHESPNEEASIEIDGFEDSHGNELDLFDDEVFCEKCLEKAWDVWEGKNGS